MKTLLKAVVFVSVLISVLGCVKKKNEKKAEEPKVEQAEPPKEEKPPIPKTNISVVAEPFKEQLKELGLPTEFKPCDLELQKDILINDDMRFDLYQRRASNHAYNADYRGIAREYENMAKVHEKNPDKYVEWLTNAASMYMRTGDEEKALEIFRDAYNTRPANVKLVSRYAIFLATAKKELRDFEQASRLANEAAKLAKCETEYAEYGEGESFNCDTDENRNLVADAYAELAFAKYGLAPACSELEQKATYSYAESRCAEFKAKNSRYTNILLKQRFKRSIRPAWRELGIPEGEASCEEQLSYIDNAAYKMYGEKKTKDAIELLEKLLAYDMHVGNYIEFLSDYAEVLYGSGNAEKAERVYELAKKITPDDCYIYASHASALAKADAQKNKDQVKKLNEEALRVCEGENRQCLFQVGLNYKKIGEYKEAQKIGKDGQKMFPTFSFYALMKK